MRTGRASYVALEASNLLMDRPRPSSIPALPVLSVILLGILYSVSGSLLSAAPLQEGSKAEHPFLFLSATDVLSLRGQAAGPRLPTAERIHSAAKAMLSRPNDFLPPSDPSQYGAKWNERFGNNLVPLAMHCLLEPDDSAAFKMLLTYADRMVGAHHWYVDALPRDEVPVAHSLVGLITAVDLLYERLGKRRQARYINLIILHGRRFYLQTKRSRQPAWMRLHVHNHSPTILLGLVMSAMVAEHHGVKEAAEWRQTAQRGFQYTLDVLRLVVDGSLNEGVAYGSYTTRSLTQYAMLARRHNLLTEDLTKHPWFRRHFEFLLFTILPGYKETIGIGDSSPTWFYGPESQLYFLDSFVLQDGHANWLAKEIREKRMSQGRLAPGRSQVWSTLHTELLWHKPGIGSHEPASAKRSLLHIFSDWGVVTYGGGTSAHQTFLSFKCSFIHGRAVHYLAKRSDLKWVNKWESFNPGHEQPDQGSFVFYPRGRPFITEALYGPKLSSLNSVLMFGPSTASCGKPLEGQLGECGKWLDYKNKETQEMSADIITASTENDMVFIAGEYAKAYSPSLQLDSVFRASILLSQDVLLILDSVLTTKFSQVKYANAFFHNIHTPFIVDDRSSAHLQSGQSTVFKVQWIMHSQHHTTVTANNVTFPAEAGQRSSNYLNVSFPLQAPGKPSRVAWLFSTSDVQVANVHFAGVSPAGVTISLQLNGEEHRVSIATEHSDIKKRFSWLGSAALAHVTTKRKLYRFGIAESDLVTTNFDHFLQTVDMSEEGLANTLLAATLITLAAVTLLLAGVKGLYKRTLLYKRLQIGIVAWVTFLITSLLLLYPDCIISPKRTNTSSNKQDSNENLPEIFYSGLPASGVHILHEVLKNNDDIITFDLSSVPRAALEPHHLELDAVSNLAACPWKEGEARFEHFPLAASWIKTIMKQPRKYLQDLQAESLQPQIVVEQESLARRGCTAIMESTGVWNSRSAWLHAVLGSAFRHILLVRDPRSWVVHQLLHGHNKDMPSVGMLLASTRQSFARACRYHNSSEVRQLQQLLGSSNTEILDKPHKFLAALWAVNMRFAMSSASAKLDQPAHQYILRFEDLLQHPEETIRKLFRWLHLPLRPAVLHKLLSLVYTEQQAVFPHGVIKVSDEVNLWKKYPLSAIYTVQDMCEPLMVELGYAVED